jgi:hypothetical protein
MSSNLHRESAYYLAHQETLARLYAGQVVVIKGGCVVGTFDDVAWARVQTKKRYGSGAFFVRKMVSVPTAKLD